MVPLARVAVVLGLLALFLPTSYSATLLGASKWDIAIVECESTTGTFSITMHRSWSPLAVERLLTLVRSGYYENIPIYRKESKFAQFGISTNSENWIHWRPRFLKDEPVSISPFNRGQVSFAASGANKRNVELFIALDEENDFGTRSWEAPIGYVSSSDMHVVDAWHSYGPLAPINQNGVHALSLMKYGEEYLRAFPDMDRIVKCIVVRDDARDNESLSADDILVS